MAVIGDDGRVLPITYLTLTLHYASSAYWMMVVID